MLMRSEERMRLRCFILLFAGMLAINLTGFASDQMTPVLMTVPDAPIPFTGSDGHIHLVYELWLTNFSSGNTAIRQVEVLGDGAVLATLDSAAIATRLQPAGSRQAQANMAPNTEALLFLHVILANGQPVPQKLTHRITAHIEAAPPQFQQMTLTGGDTAPDRKSKVVVVGPPLRGGRYISADSCCDATRHTRAAMPVNGRVWLAQRFAVDWEQMDAQNRIYVGPQKDVTSYIIYGKEAIAVADATVAFIVDGMPNQVPGAMPAAIAVDQADGNAVILDLGGGNYALYAHLQTGSIRVHPGDKVKRGQTLGLVGNSGNSLAPHLHFHVMDGPSPMASNGIPYEIDSFQVAGTTAGTAAFDEAEAKGTPLAIMPLTPPLAGRNSLPLDQLIVAFPQ
jgi:hypothetical protein